MRQALIHTLPITQADRVKHFEYASASARLTEFWAMYF
jgi:hypothetical protein